MSFTASIGVLQTIIERELTHVAALSLPESASVHRTRRVVRLCSRAVSAPLGPNNTPFDVVGHDAAVALAHRFYDHMDAHEPELVAVHKTENGKVAPEVRERFALFLVEWLGGPRSYSDAHGHPRLRMRHGHVPIGVDLRDAWMRCMKAALEHPTINDDVRGFLMRRFAEVADFLRNRVER